MPVIYELSGVKFHDMKEIAEYFGVDFALFMRSITHGGLCIRDIIENNATKNLDKLG